MDIKSIVTCTVLNYDRPTTPSDATEICLVLFTSERRTVWHESGKSREMRDAWQAQYTQRERQRETVVHDGPVLVVSCQTRHGLVRGL